MPISRTEIAKGGWSFDRKDYSPPIMKFLSDQIENRRFFVDISEGAEKGYRFKDTASVIARVISNYTEEEFMADPILTVDAMLMDAAQSDWWYSHEKRYEDDYEQEPSDSCEEENE